MSARLLIVEDDPAMRDLLTAALTRRGMRPTPAPSAEVALRLTAEADFDVFLTDVNLMGGMDGLTLCQRLKESHPDVPVVVLTAFGSMDTAVAAMRAGAWDFITKPVEMDALALALERAVEHRRLKDEVARLRKAAAGGAPGGLVGESDAAQRLRAVIDRVADKQVTVLIVGEAGSGKEVVARAIHEKSRWRSGPFVDVNCAAIPETMLESELFGHVKGAFTDARGARAGLLATARGGTFFLDEVGELSPALQPKLLRVLQERTYRPVGSDEPVPFEARLIAATNRDLERDVREGRFREDLFYRLNVVTIEVPPLRARGADVVLLAKRFIARAAETYGVAVTGLTPGATRALMAYPWPGNVRQLQHTMEHAVVMAESELITVDDLPAALGKGAPAPRASVAGEDAGPLLPLEVVERQHILRVLEAVGGSRTVAAETLGLDRKTLYRKLERYVTDGHIPPEAAR